MFRMEAELVRKWREAKGLTQDELAENCPRKLTRGGISSLETRQADGQRAAQRASITLDNLLNLIYGLGIEGDSDAQRLATFFLGPGAGSEPKTAYFSHDNSHPENYRLGRIRAYIAGTINEMVKDGRATREEIADALGLSLTELSLVQALQLPISLPQLQRLCVLGKVSADEILDTGVALPAVVQQRLNLLLEGIQSMRNELDSLAKDIERLNSDTA
jgi:transcriptional regulator with XRE-family HTH domain